MRFFVFLSFDFSRLRFRGIFLSFLGVVFYRKHAAPFHLFAIGVLAMLPAAVFFLWKINIHPWMDKNDVAHILASIGNVFFYIGIVKVTPELNQKFNTQRAA